VGTYATITDNSSNWDTAYTYSQVGHLPLSGGTLTGTLTVEAVVAQSNTQPKYQLIETDTTDENKEILVSGGDLFIRNLNDNGTVPANENILKISHEGAVTLLAQGSTTATNLNALFQDSSGNIKRRTLGSLAYISATYDNYGSWTIADDGTATTTQIGSGNTLNIVGGDGINAVLTSSNTLTISSTITDTDTNTFLSSASFNTGDGIITLTKNDASTVTVDIDGRYAIAGDENIIDGASSIWNADGDGDVFVYNDSNPTHNGKTVGAVLNVRGDGASDGILVRAGIFTGHHVSTSNGYYVGTLLSTANSTTTQVIDNLGNWTGNALADAKISSSTNWNSAYNNTIASASFNTSTGVISLVQNDAGFVTVDIDGRFALSSHTHDDRYYTEQEIQNFFNGVTAISGYSPQSWDTAYNNHITAVEFNTGTGVLTLTQNDGGSITKDLDGRYLTSFDITTQTDPKYLRSDTSDTMSGSLTITGTLSASVKSFDIKHPTQKGKRLIYGVLEGPEHSVFFRGRSQSKNIELPEEWTGLIDPETITVQLTPVGKAKTYYYIGYKDNKIEVGVSGCNWKYDYFYIVHATRIDVEPLQTVKDAN